jgi:hypothetical protein
LPTRAFSVAASALVCASDSAAAELKSEKVGRKVVVRFLAYQVLGELSRYANDHLPHTDGPHAPVALADGE